MRRPAHPRNQKARRAGFTAVEIAMVATVIAILALLILPIFRSRAEEAKKVAAQDDLASITKALLLAEADLDGFTPRLNDLDNVLDTTAVTITAGTEESTPPYAEWNRTLGFTNTGAPAINNRNSTVVPNWKGPYIAVRNTRTLNEVAFTNAGAIWPNGPIYIVGRPGTQPYNDGTRLVVDDRAEDRYPVDPWGNPYLLFGRGTLTGAPGETDFQTRVVYSMGPNGQPGSLTTLPANAYRREAGILGTGDDYEFEF